MKPPKHSPLSRTYIFIGNGRNGGKLIVLAKNLEEAGKCIRWNLFDSTIVTRVGSTANLPKGSPMHTRVFINGKFPT